MRLTRYSDRILFYLLLGLFGVLVFFSLAKFALLFILIDSLISRMGRIRLGETFKRAEFWWLFSFFLLYLIGGMYSDNRSEWVFQLESKSIFFIGSLLLLTASPEIRDHKGLLMKWLVAIAVGGILFSLGQGFYRVLTEDSWYRTFPDGSFDSWYLSYTALADGVNHPSYYSLLIVAAISALFYIRRLPIHSWRPWIVHSILGILLVFLLLLQARMVILAFLGILGILFFSRIFQERKKWRWGIMALLIVALGSLTILKQTHNLGRFGDLTELSYDITDPEHAHFNGFTIRLAEWSCAWDVIRDNPIFGVGSGDGKDALINSYQEKGFKIGVERKYNPHNQYLQTWIAVGLPGLAWLLITTFTMIRHGFRGGSAPLLIWAGTFFLSLVAESVLEREAGLIHFFFIGSLFYFGFTGAEKEETQEESEK